LGKRGQHPNSQEAGAKNLAKWQAEEGYHQQALKHGAYSATIRQKYSDRRTAQGKRLKAVEDDLVEDLGGPLEINAAQSVILGGLRSKFIVIFQIGDFLDRQTSIISKDGELMPCLGRNFLSYTDSIRRDLETLYGMAKTKIKRQVPKLEDLISKSKEDAGGHY
jgi:hypothetical protein